MSQPAPEHDSDLLTDLVTGERSPDEPEVAARLAADPELRARYEELRAVAERLDALGCTLRETREVPAASFGGDEEDREVEGFRETVRAAPPGGAAPPGRRSVAPRLLRLSLPIAAALAVWVLWRGLPHDAGGPSSGTGSEGPLLLQGEDWLRPDGDAPFGTAAWSLVDPADGELGELDLRAWELDEGGRRTRLILERRGATSPVRVLSPQDEALPRAIEYEASLRVPGSPPRLARWRQRR